MHSSSLLHFNITHLNFRVRLRLGASQTPFNLEVEIQKLEGVVDFKMDDFKIHPNYSDPKAEYDLAIITLDTDIIWSKTIFPICLPSVGDTTLPLDIFAGRSAKLSGWGKTKIYQKLGELPTDLQETHLTVEYQG